MVDETHQESPLRWEKRKHQGLVALAILASGLIASAPRNERRMFVLPHEIQIASPFAMIDAPEPTALRSPIMGYLNDGCGADMTSGLTGDFAHAVERQDCGRGRSRPQAGEREPVTNPVLDPVHEPAAYLAVPEQPAPLENSPLPVVNELALVPQDLPILGRGDPFFGPAPRNPGGTPVALVTSGVPEPASWALMIGGFMLAGGVLRQRKQGELALQA